MPVDEPDDESAGGLPPDPLDRLWFHPSELSGAAVAGPVGAPSRPHRDWGLAGAAALLGALVTAGVLAGAGAFGGDATTTIPTGVGTATALTGTSGDPTARLVSFAGPSVVGVRAVGLAETKEGSGVALGRTRVLTSASLLEGSGSVTVATASGRAWAAQVVGVDPDTDLALLQVDGGALPVAKLGADDDVEVGQTVVALAAAGGDHHWAGEGVVAAVDRIAVLASGRTLAGLIETDVRAGDAVGGGALVDESGAVIGVLSRAVPGLALPIDVARDVADQIAATGSARHGWLGVAASDAGDRTGGGARVDAVTPTGPAEAAGLVPGDVITVFGNDRVTDSADLMAAVVRRKPGDPITVTAWQGEDRVRRQVSLGDRATAPPPDAPVSSAAG